MTGGGEVAATVGARAEEVLARCRRLGVQPAQLRRLPGYGRLLAEPAEQSDSSRSSCGQQKRRWLLPALLVLLSAVLLQQQLYTVAGLSRLLFRLEGVSEEAERVSAFLRAGLVSGGALSTEYDSARRSAGSVE